jgi:sugar phosphate isomerase/epimerase
MRRAVTRRELVGLAGAAVAASVTAPGATAPAEGPGPEPFRYCLNTSTLRGQKLPIVETVEIAAKAGYQGLEPWISELEQHIRAGGSLKELGDRLRDRGLAVESAIGFAEWIVDDEARRARALEQAKREMEMVRAIGGRRIAAPPAGATDRADLDLLKVAERYRSLLEVGAQFEVVPQVELWGFSQTLNRLGAVTLVAMESGRPEACILPDVYHLYRGGSDFGGLRLLSGSAFHVIHVNDYPAQPPREQITDAHRVYPGDGVAPLGEILRALRQIGFRGALSLELFNRDYWQQDPLTVAKTGLAKMRAAVEKSRS